MTKEEVLAAANAKGLSDDAKTVASAWFGSGRVGSTLHFGMVQSRPSERAQRGLDELVEAGVLSVSPDISGKGVTYTCLESSHPYFVWYLIESGMPGNTAVSREDPRFGFKLTDAIEPGENAPRSATLTLSGPPEMLAKARRVARSIDRSKRT